MKIRPAFHGALLGLWLCLFTLSFCYGDDKTIEAAGEPNKVFAEFKTTEVVEHNEEGKFAVPTPKSFFKKPRLHKVPIVKKPLPSPVTDLEFTFPPVREIPPVFHPPRPPPGEPFFHPISTNKESFPPPLHKIPTVKKPLPSPVPDLEFPFPPVREIPPVFHPPRPPPGELPHPAP